MIGTNEDILWKNCNPEYRVKFLKCLKEFPDDWVRAFHVYETESHRRRSSLATSDGGAKSIGIKGISCHVVSSVTIGPQTFACDSILASTTSESFVFIFPIEGAAWRHVHFIEVPTQYITQHTRHITEEANKHKDVLIIGTDPAGYFVINGKEHRLSGPTVYVTSDQGLAELYDTHKERAKTVFKQGQVGRRLSSAFVTLDTAAEVARKSSWYHRESSQISRQQRHRTRSSQSLHDEQSLEALRNRQENVDTFSLLGQETSPVDENPFSTMEDITASADAPGRTHQLESAAEGTTEIQNSLDVQFQDTARPNHDSGMPKQKFQNGSPMPSANVQSDPAPTTAAAGGVTSPIITNPMPCENQEGKSNRMKEQETQKGRRRERSTRSRPSNRKGRAMQPDTQESLIFHGLRRSNRNVYKRNPKAAVDWEEDLRPTPTRDREEAENQVQEDDEVTSVSSPSPGDTSIFAKPSGIAQKKRKFQAESSKKNKQARAKRAAHMGGNNILSLPLQATNVKCGSSDIKTTTENDERQARHKANNKGKEGNCNEGENQLDLTSHSNKPDNTVCAVAQRVYPSPGNNKDNSSTRALQEQCGQSTNESTASNIIRHGSLGLKPFSKLQNDEIERIPAQTMAEAKKSSFHYSELEQNQSASSSRDRSLAQDFVDEKEAKEPYITDHIPGHQTMHRSGKCSQEEESKAKGTMITEVTKGSLGNKPHEKHLAPLSTDHRPKALASETETDPDSLHTSIHEGQTYVDLAMTPVRKHIIDENGSPRLVSRPSDKNNAFCKKRELPRSERATYLFEDASSQSGYNASSDEDLTDKNMSYTSSISAREKKKRVYLPGSLSRVCSPSSSVTDVDKLKDIDSPSIKRRVPATVRPKRWARRSEQTVDTVITPFNISGSPHREYSTFEARCGRRIPKTKTSTSQPSPSISSIRLEQELQQLGGDRTASDRGAELKGSLETVQKATHDMLLNTSKVSLVTSIKVY